MKRLLLIGLACLGLAASCPPKPPLPDPCQPVPDAEPKFTWESPTDLEMTWVDMPVTVGGGDEACVLQRRLFFDFNKPQKVLTAYSFHGFDQGDSVESLSVLYAKDGKPLYKRSEHIGEVTAEYDAFDDPQPVDYVTDGFILDVVCRVTGNNANTGDLSARCHLAVYVEIEEATGGSKCSLIPHPDVPATPHERQAIKKPKVKKAIQAVDAACGGTCETWIITLERLAEWLNGNGECAYGAWEDGLAVRLANGDVEEFHPVSSFNTWTDNMNGKYRATWVYGPPGDECRPPLPPPANEILLHRRGGTPTGPIFDSTGLVKDFDYCTSVGFVNRGSCPVRPECPPGDPCPFPDRAACELRTFGVPVWKTDGRVVDLTGNPWRKRIKDGTWVQVCTGPTISPEVCSVRKEY